MTQIVKTTTMSTIDKVERKMSRFQTGAAQKNVYKSTHLGEDRTITPGEQLS